MSETVQFAIGPVTGTVFTTWGIMLVLLVGSWLSTRRLSLVPGRWQTAVEGVVVTIERVQ